MQENEDISPDTWRRRMQDKLDRMLADEILMRQVKDFQAEVKESFEKDPFYIRDNSASNHHESQAPSETSREQDHRQSEP